MNQELTYTVSEAVAALSDPIKTQTLYSWVRKIEKYTPKYKQAAKPLNLRRKP